MSTGRIKDATCLFAGRRLDRGARSRPRRRRKAARTSSRARPSPTSSPPRAGGGYDLYGRLVAEYMQRYLPGSTFVVRNMPGAGHLVGTNAIYASRPDGLTIGTFNTGLIYNQLVGLPGMKFDLTKMSWIGKATTEPRAIVIAQQSPIKTFADLQASKEPVNFATSGVGSANYVETMMLTNALKLPAKILTGYNGNDDQLAMRRGEVVGTHRLALLLRAVRQERLRPLRRPDRRQGHRRAAAARPGQRSGGASR